MKVCVLCKEERPLSEYNRASRRLDGLQNVCRKCNRERSRAYYHQNREKHLKVVRANTKKRIAANQHLMLEYLKDKSCVDCGYNAHPAALDFDHQHSKRANISNMVGDGFSWETILKEIAKCEIRCSNCHRIRTAETFGYYTARDGVCLRSSVA